MTSQPARRLYVPRTSLLDRKLGFYVSKLHQYTGEVKELLDAGKNVRNVIRILNVRHKFTKKSKRKADMTILRERPGIAEILRSGLTPLLQKMLQEAMQQR
jgi:hypothetical protein